jgi:hypothetical protein
MARFILPVLIALFTCCQQASVTPGSSCPGGDCQTSGPSKYQPGSSPVSCTLTGSLEQSCPAGVSCDEHFDYHAYEGTVDSIYLYFSFSPAILSGKSLASCQADLNYLEVTVNLPSKKTDTSTCSYIVDDAIRGMPGDTTYAYHEITGFDHDTLKGLIYLKFDNYIEWITSNSPDCRIGDIGGKCTKTHYAPVEYHIAYKIALHD